MHRCPQCFFTTCASTSSSTASFKLWKRSRPMRDSKEFTGIEEALRFWCSGMFCIRKPMAE